MRLRSLAGPASLLALAALAAVSPARATYIVTFSQAGPDVVASDSGSINTNGLTFVAPTTLHPMIQPDFAVEVTGATGLVDIYTGTISGPRSFGPGDVTSATAGTGSIAGFNGPAGEFSVPQGYVSGAPLSDTATYAGQTFASLGLDLGSYVYSFGSGADADTITVDIVAPPSVPEPASLALFGTGVLGLGLVRRRRRG